MNWPKVCLKYQRYESFHSCLGARKIICRCQFPDIGAKEKIKEKKEQIRKGKKEDKF